MSDVNKEMSRIVYDTICKVLDDLGISYKKIEDDLVVLFGHKGQDMSHDLIILVNEKQELIRLVEKLPFDINSEKASDFAAAVCYVNSKIACGCFVYDMENRLTFEMSQFYSGSLIGDETIRQMIMGLVVLVEEYDDKFMALNKGYLKPEDFKN